MQIQADGLHLRAAHLDGRLFCSEMISDDIFGYGTYEFEVASDTARLDSNLVLGLFTWSDSGDYANHEIDLEASRWGEPEHDAYENMQYVVQPPRPESVVRFRIPPSSTIAVHTFLWQPRSVTFKTSVSGIRVKRARIDRHVPASDGHVHFNLWAMKENLAGDGDAEVVIRSFRFSPAVQ